ncbi:MAG: ferrous iron transport protein A [Desulfobacteraceae bacterium]|nr:ferrous iron transport protein A [Desulfobacteraceae bacterium]MBC2749595.1 FeoA domain-containing protein [Desulfobacteraceae bacterium]
MYIPLTDAPADKPLVLVKVADPNLALRLKRMGLFAGSKIVRLGQEVLVQPIRVRGPKGDAVLGGGMAMKIVVHLNDGRKLPLAEMQPGETGHIEGLTGGTGLAGALETLALKLNDRIHVVRKLPPMEYIAVIEGAGRVRLTEGMAAKIWGRMQARLLQFVSARAGEKFQVEKILGGTKARRMLRTRGIEPGKVLILEGVAQAQSLQVGVRNPVVISSREGLRLFLTPSDGKQILVRGAGTEG